MTPPWAVRRSLRRSGTSGRSRESGQSTVEFALVLPLLLALVLVGVQVGLVMRDQLVLAEAVANGARAAVRDPQHDAVSDAVRNTGGLDPGRLSVAVTTSGRYVTVSGTYRVRLAIPVLDIGTTLTLRNTLVVRTEPPA